MRAQQGCRKQNRKVRKPVGGATANDESAEIEEGSDLATVHSGKSADHGEPALGEGKGKWGKKTRL